MSHLEDVSTPQKGEALILGDGRAFRLSAVEQGTRGWWFRAIALDGCSTLQGNLALQWDAQAGSWRPTGMAADAAPVPPLPPSMRGPTAPKRKQLGSLKGYDSVAQEG